MTPDSPLQINRSASLVLVWPSTLIRLNDFLAASVRTRCASAGVRLASVVMMANIVAMLGPIIPAPFARPAKLIFSLAPNSNELKFVFGPLSVVRIALDAFSKSESSLFSSLAATPIPLVILSIGSKCPMTPVERTRTWFVCAPIALAAKTAICSLSSMPCCPVQALALPELMTTARNVSVGVRLRFQSILAARTTFCV